MAEAKKLRNGSPFTNGNEARMLTGHPVQNRCLMTVGFHQQDMTPPIQLTLKAFELMMGLMNTP